MNRRTQSGFTLIELMVTLVVAAILLGVAVPAFFGFIERNSRVAATNEYFSGLQFTRSEAIKRNSAVSICPSSDAATCSGSNWESGFIVYNNPNLDTTVNGESGETVLRSFAGLENPNITVRASTVDMASVIHFSANGFPQTATGAPVTGVIKVCDTGGVASAMAIELSGSGRARVTDSDTVVGSCP